VDGLAGVVKAFEALAVRAFVPQMPVERLDERILHGLARANEVQTGIPRRYAHASKWFVVNSLPLSSIWLFAALETEEEARALEQCFRPPNSLRHLKYVCSVTPSFRQTSGTLAP
jgi:hypothetical protein